MSGFAALMALSATQTKQSQDSVQSALMQRQRKEEQRKKQQEEQEKKEREMENRLRIKHFEEAKRQEEIKQRREHEQEMKERERKRREDEERDALRYGPKKAKSEGPSKWPSTNSHSRDEVRRKRLPTNSDDEGSGAQALTREEKRQRKEEAELRRSLTFGRRATQSSARRPGGKLPGGAINVTSAKLYDTGSPDADLRQSIKARISAIPNTLTKLNVNKRDTRTIDEILQDRAKARETKVLDGEEAKEFNDWFGGAKKKDSPKKPTLSTASAPSSGANTPASQIPPSKNANGAGSSATMGTIAKKTNVSKSSASSSNNSKGASTPKMTSASKTSHADSKVKRTIEPSGSRVRAAHSTSNSRAKSSSVAHSNASSRKRTRSPSFSDAYDSDSLTPPPTKRRAAPQTSGGYRDEIWKLFGKDRNAYVGRDVLSDDEDMEADATALEREEFRSARLAKKEDEAALEEERRHEEEKRRKRKEKEIRERRG